MNKIIYIALAIVAIAAISCKGNSKKTETTTETTVKVQVLYFHGERRCPTCIAVGDVAKQTVEEKYAGNKDVVFKDINIDEKENEEIAEKYEIAGSSLLICANGKVENITGMAFQNAKSNPELLKGKIIELVDAGLK